MVDNTAVLRSIILKPNDCQNIYRFVLNATKHNGYISLFCWLDLPYEYRDVLEVLVPDDHILTHKPEE